MISSAPFRGLPSGESPRKASKGAIDVDHHHSAADSGWPLNRSLARRRRRAGEMNFPQAEQLRPAVKEGS
jgi:hypothetical protein